MATTSQAPAPQAFTINLKFLDNGDIDATGDYQETMKCGDTARFVVLDPQGNPATNVDSVLIEFRSRPTVDLNDRPVPADLLPFGVASLGNPTTAFLVANACAAFMLVTIVTSDGRIHHCAWDPATSIQGSGVCTLPVKCPKP